MVILLIIPTLELKRAIAIQIKRIKSVFCGEVNETEKKEIGLIESRREMIHFSNHYQRLCRL